MRYTQRVQARKEGDLSVALFAPFSTGQVCAD
jgi:hypothetical protein